MQTAEMFVQSSKTLARKQELYKNWKLEKSIDTTTPKNEKKLIIKLLLMYQM